MSFPPVSDLPAYYRENVVMWLRLPRACGDPDDAKLGNDKRATLAAEGKKFTQRATLL